MLRFFPVSLRKVVAVALLAAFVPLTSACFGSFHTTRKLVGFNKGVSPNKWIQWFVFLGLTFIPIITVPNTCADAVMEATSINSYFSHFSDLAIATNGNQWLGISAWVMPNNMVPVIMLYICYFF